MAPGLAAAAFRLEPSQRQLDAETDDKVGDERTEHTSLPVLRGEKFLFVTWLWRDPRTRRVVLDSDGGVLGTLPIGGA